jgi:hypothetical protein
MEGMKNAVFTPQKKKFPLRGNFPGFRAERGANRQRSAHFQR